MKEKEQDNVIREFDATQSVQDAWKGMDLVFLNRFAKRAAQYFPKIKPSPEKLKFHDWQLLAQVISQANTAIEANAVWKMLAPEGVEYELGREALEGAFTSFHDEAIYYIQFKKLMKEDATYGE